MTASRWDINATADLPSEEFSSGSWFSIDDTEGNVGRLFVRVSESTDGRLVITGLHMSDDQQITADTLRAVQPAAILKTIAWRERGESPPLSLGQIGPTGLARFEGVAMEISTAVESADPIDEPSKHSSRAPHRADLEQFAKTYRIHLRENAYNPVKATLDDLRRHGQIMSRATAHRNLNRCRELGLLEQREENR